MLSNTLIVISKSNRPLNAHRAHPKASVADIPTVPLECIRNSLDRICAEHRVYRKKRQDGAVIPEDIQDAAMAITVIEYALFLHVETQMSIEEFLTEYAVVPNQCSVCKKDIGDRVIHVRLAHIIRCRWGEYASNPRSR